MGWKPKQLKAAGAAAYAAGFERDHVDMILRQFENRAIFEGKLTRKSPDLNDSDFEVYMGICERAAGGKLGKFDRGRFSDTAERELHRIRFVALRRPAGLDTRVRHARAHRRHQRAFVSRASEPDQWIKSPRQAQRREPGQEAIRS
jgi:hypothetical protein